jgi:hypothetical protein
MNCLCNISWGQGPNLTKNDGRPFQPQTSQYGLLILCGLNNNHGNTQAGEFPNGTSTRGHGKVRSGGKIEKTLHSLMNTHSARVELMNPI